MSDPFDPAADPPTSASFDTDGDGIADTTLIDSTGDGFVDTVVEHDPWTGATAVARDLTGDGNIDVVAVDHDGDGLVDEAWGDDVHDPDAPDGTQVGPFDPGSAGPPPEPGDGIHGEPRADIEYHQVQPGPVDCLPTSVSMVLSEITGETVPAEDLVGLANDLGFMVDDGMAAEGALTLLEHHGADAELTSGTLDDLRAALGSGDPIIVGLDAADVYWGGGGPFDPGLESGHAVVITGMDDGPPGAVYVNDPGLPSGAGVEIPLELFVDAWEDNDNTLIIAEAQAGQAGEEVAVGGAEPPAGGATSVSRLFMLPLTFVLPAP